MKTAFRCFLAAAAALASAEVHAAKTYHFLFDADGFGQASGTIGPHIVGAGIFVSGTDLGVGTYALNSLSSYSFSFTFLDGSTLTNADIATPPDEVAVRISDFGGKQRLVFTEAPVPGDEGPYSGALDLMSDSGLVSFEPTYAGGNDEYVYLSMGDAVQGNYLALSAPEPASWAMFIGGFGLIGGTMRRRQRSSVRFA